MEHLPKGIHYYMRGYRINITLNRYTGAVIRQKTFKYLDDAIEYRDKNLDKVIW